MYMKKKKHIMHMAVSFKAHTADPVIKVTVQSAARPLQSSYV